MVSTSNIAQTIDASASLHSSNVPAALRVERRRDPRYSISLLGRFMRANKQEYPCQLRDISVGGAAILSPVDVEKGERIIVYFEHLGGLEGSVARQFDGGFAIELKATQHKRDKLAGQLEWLNNRSGDHEMPQRRHERISLGDTSASLRFDDDIVIPVSILDVSVSGASVKTDARPDIGSEALLGRMRARVVRYHETGLGLEFVDIQNPDALRRYFD
ncbi:PilZ domain-containing protein [Leptospira interrogans]